MRQRPIRSQLYLPILRFGITDEDWGVVLLAGLLGYAVPFVLDLKLYRIPVELLGWVFMIGLSVLALNLIRRRRRPGWLKQTIRAQLRGRNSRRWLPDEHEPPWLMTTPSSSAPGPQRSPNGRARSRKHQPTN